MKNKKPLVSVIIPVFNGALYLGETIASIQKSTYKNFEIILVDDGSTDKSKSICEKLEKKYKNVVFYSFPKNKGMGRVLNFGLKKAKGKYILRINQDDRMLRNRMETQVDFFGKNPEVVAVGSYIKLFNKNDNQTIVKFLENDEDIKKIWLILSPFSDPSVMYRKDIALKAGGYDQSFWPADDVHMWYRMGKLGKLANISEPLVEIRWHSEAGSLRFFRKNTIRTYKLHLWANKNIQKANMGVHLFWLCQLICGLILPARLNWSAYRLIKKIVGGYLEIRDYFKKRPLSTLNILVKILINKKMVVIVTNHPKKLKRFGI